MHQPVLLQVFLLHIVCCPCRAQSPFLTSSNLPIVVIEAEGRTIPDEPRITARMGIVNNPDGLRNRVSDPYNEYDGRIGIEIRGKSTQMFFSFPRSSVGMYIAPQKQEPLHNTINSDWT